MASWKIRRRLLIILSSFTGITLIQCRSLLQFSGTEKTNDEGGEHNSEQFMSDLKGFVPLDDFDYLGDDAEVSGIINAWFKFS